MRVPNASMIKLPLQRKPLSVLRVAKFCGFNEQIQVKVEIIRAGFDPSWKWLTLGIRNWLCMTTVCTKTNTVLASLTISPPRAMQLWTAVIEGKMIGVCASAKCLWQMWWYKMSTRKRSRMTWGVKRRVCRKWDVCRRLFCRCSKWADRCCCHQISMSYGGVCSCDEVTSAALLRNSMLSKWT